MNLFFECRQQGLTLQGETRDPHTPKSPVAVLHCWIEAPPRTCPMPRATGTHWTLPRGQARDARVSVYPQ